MSWSSKALPWLIPSLFLTAPVNGLVVVVSPWIEDVNLHIIRWEGSTNLEGDVPLTEVIRWLHQERQTRFQFYVRLDQLKPMMNWRLAAISRKVTGLIDLYGIPDLHAKMIITDSVVLETSANLLTRSLYRNVETITVQDNKDDDARIFSRKFFTRHGILI